MLIETVLANREQSHGLYRDQATFAQSLKRFVRSSKNWERLDPCQAQSIEACCDKISRILIGNYNEPDHWQDISGYASLVVRELDERTGGTVSPEVPYAKPPVSMKGEEESFEAPEFLLKKMEDDMEQLLKK